MSLIVNDVEHLFMCLDFPCGLVVKPVQEMQEMRVRSLGREDALEEENGNPLQYYCLKNSIHKRSLVATVHGLAKGQT